MIKLILFTLSCFFSTFGFANCIQKNDKDIDFVFYNKLNEYRLNGDFNKLNDSIFKMNEGYYKNYLIGYSYLIGSGRLKDLSLAEFYLEKTKESCYSPAYYSLGYLYSITNRKELADIFYREAENLGNLYASYELAQNLKRKGEWNAYIDQITLISEQDFLPAILDLADIYVEKDLEKSIYYYRKAAMMNDKVAQKKLLNIYENIVDNSVYKEDMIFWKRVIDNS